MGKSPNWRWQSERINEYTVYSGYSGQVHSGNSDIVSPLTGTKYIYSIIFRSDIVTNRI